MEEFRTVLSGLHEFRRQPGWSHPGSAEGQSLRGQYDHCLKVKSGQGWYLGEKRIIGKNSLWDRSTREPLIFAGPRIRSHGRCVGPAELLDIYPTLSELCELPVPVQLAGHSLMQQLGNPGQQRRWPAITTHNHNDHAIRSRDWRFIQYADGTEELYDIRSAPTSGIIRREILSMPACCRNSVAGFPQAADRFPVAGTEFWCDPLMEL